MMKPALLMISFGLLSAAQASAQHPQQHRIMLPTQNIDFSVDPPVVHTSPGGSIGTSPSQVSNGVHGPDGKLLFYVSRGHVINRFGSGLGPLVNHITPGTTLSGIFEEVAIVPIPYTCRYYVIYTEYMPHAGYCSTGGADAFSTYYAVVDMGINNGEGAIVENGIPIALCNISGYCSMAVRWLNYVPPFTPPPAGSSSGVYQYLYRAARNSLGNIDVIRYDITASGIGSPTHVITIPHTLGGHMGEMDISEDGTRLVMSNAGQSNTPHDVFIVHLDGNGLLNTSLGNQFGGLSTFNINNHATGHFSGQEFSFSGNYLFVAHATGGIYRLTLSSGSVSQISNTSQFGNSQLEMSYHPTGSHKILAASSGGIGAIMNPEATTPTFNASYIPGAVTATNHSWGTKRLLPDQMDGFNYVGYQISNSGSCCKAFPFDALSYTVSGTGSVTWTPASNPFNNQSVIGIRDELVIPSGRTLTLKNLELRFDELAHIRVLPNAKLIIDNSKLTRITECGDRRWRGIYVSGNSTSSQTVSPTHFGTVEAKNGAIIEYANDALNNFGLTVGGDTDWNALGGIVIANNATFRINRRSAQFLSYTNKNHLGNPINDKSGFVKCGFITNDDYIGTPPDAQITQWDTRGVDVLGSHFINQRPSNGNPVGRGHGIYSIDAIYAVKEHCAIIPGVGQPCPAQHRTPTKFERLHYGVAAVAGSKQSAVADIRGNEFKDNRAGVVLSGSGGSTVWGNVFSPGLTGPLPVGVFLDHISTYTVECNEFNANGTAPVGHNNHRVGITSYNCGVNASPIRKNLFKNLYVGAEAQGSNRSSTGTGLQYLSNTFDGNYVGVIVLEHGSLPHQGIAAFQGTASVPAGNYFSQQSGLLDFYNVSQHVSYRRHAGTGPWIPTVYAPTTTLSATSVAWQMWSCGSEMMFMGGGVEQADILEAESFESVEGAEQLESFAALIADMEADGRNYMNLTEMEIATLTGLAEYDGIAGNCARNVLQFIGRGEYEVTVLPVPPLPKHRISASDTSDVFSFKVFPNPTKDYITVGYVLEGPNTGNVFFEVMDVHGRVLLQTPMIEQDTQTVVASVCFPQDSIFAASHRAEGNCTLEALLWQISKRI